MEQAVKKQRRAKGSGSFVPGKGAKEGKIMYRVQLPNGKRKQFEGKTETEAYRKYKEWLREKGNDMVCGLCKRVDGKCW